MKTLHSTILLGLAAGLAAQTSTFTSPRGFDTVEGATSHGYILGSKIQLTFQQLDATLRGNVTGLLKSIAWRRDGTSATSADYSARQMEMEVVLCDTVCANVSTTHANNYLGTPTTVFTKKFVSAPDWTQLPASTPAPFNFKVVFDSQWLYTGVNDLLWEVRVTQNTYAGTAFTNYPYDFDYIGQSGAVFSTTATGVAVGTGCTSTGMTSAFRLTGSIYTHPNRLRMTLGTTYAPALTPVSVYVDAVDSNLNIPGLCGVLHALPTIEIPLATSTSTGSIATKTFDNLPYNSSFPGVQLHFQAIALDLGQTTIPVSVSNGLDVTIAAPPANVGTIARVYSYLSGSTVLAPTQWTGGMITQFEY